MRLRVLRSEVWLYQGRPQLNSPHTNIKRRHDVHCVTRLPSACHCVAQQAVHRFRTPTSPRHPRLTSPSISALSTHTTVTDVGNTRSGHNNMRTLEPLRAHIVFLDLIHHANVSARSRLTPCKTLTSCTPLSQVVWTLKTPPVTMDVVVPLPACAFLIVSSDQCT